MIIKCKHCMGDNFAAMNSKLGNLFTGAEHCPFCGRFIGKNDYHASEPAKIVEMDNHILSDREETHPAYAQLSFSRQSGGHSNLYGSAIKHQQTITMRIYASKKMTSKYSERYYGENTPIVEVRMSQSQFAQAITSMNQGSGIPVTLESLRGKSIPKCEEKSISEIATEGLREKMDEFTNKMSSGQKRIKEIIDKKGTILKGERKEIGNIYSILMNDLRHNMPFLHECMVEAYDKTATSAKADIEAFYDNAIRKMGLDAMKNKQLGYEVNDSGRLQITDDNVVDVEGKDVK